MPTLRRRNANIQWDRSVPGVVTLSNVLAPIMSTTSTTSPTSTTLPSERPPWTRTTGPLTEEEAAQLVPIPTTPEASGRSNAEQNFDQYRPRAPEGTPAYGRQLRRTQRHELRDFDRHALYGDLQGPDLADKFDELLNSRAVTIDADGNLISTQTAGRPGAAERLLDAYRAWQDAVNMTTFPSAHRDPHPTPTPHLDNLLAPLRRPGPSPAPTPTTPSPTTTTTPWQPYAIRRPGEVPDTPMSTETPPPSSGFTYGDREAMQLMKWAKHDPASTGVVHATRRQAPDVTIYTQRWGHHLPRMPLDNPLVERGTAWGLRGFHTSHDALRPGEEGPIGQDTIDVRYNADAAGTLAHELTHHLLRSRGDPYAGQREEQFAQYMARQRDPGWEAIPSDARHRLRDLAVSLLGPDIRRGGEVDLTQQGSAFDQLNAKLAAERAVQWQEPGERGFWGRMAEGRSHVGPTYPLPPPELRNLLDLFRPVPAVGERPPARWGTPYYRDPFRGTPYDLLGYQFPR